MPEDRPFQFSLRAFVIVLLALPAAGGVLFYFFDFGHAAVEKPNEYIGVSYIGVVETLGKPEYECAYPLSEANGNFREPLQYVLKGSDPKTIIRESRWKFNRHTIDIWFTSDPNGKWTSVDALRWQDGVQF